MSGMDREGATPRSDSEKYREAEEKYRKGVEKLRRIDPALAVAFPAEPPRASEFFGLPQPPAAPEPQASEAPTVPKPPATRAERRDQAPGRFKRGSGAVRKRWRTYWIRYHLNGRRIEEPTRAKTAAEARLILNERLGDVAKGVTPAAASRVRLSELYDDVRADYLNKGQDLDTLRDRWKHIEPAFGSDFVRTITQPRMQGYVEARRAEGAAASTIKNEIAALRRMLRLGYENRKVAQLPTFPTIKTNNVRMVFFEADEFDRLMPALAAVIADGRDVGNDWLVPLVVTARWVGTRREELLRLERRQLDLATGKVTLDPGTTKNDEGRVFFLPAEALAALQAWDAKTQALERERGVIVRNVFHRHGEPVRHFPYEVWHDACARARISGRRVPHDFRRTAARAYRRAGVSEGVVMKVLGHKTRSIFERYNIKNEDDLREAAQAVAATEPGRTGTGGPKVVPFTSAATEKP